MTNVTVSQVTTRKELRAFVRFNYKLYKDCPQAVPDLLEDTLDTLDARSNPAFRFCDAAFFLARIDGEIVGRVVGENVVDDAVERQFTAFDLEETVVGAHVFVPFGTWRHARNF